MKILLVTGGTSSERKISFMSAKAVKIALEEKNHKVKLFDLKEGYAELKRLSKDFDVIFPVIHGEEGEGGKLHKYLKSLVKPFVGGSWKSFQKGWYKIPFKKFCDKNKILTSSWKKAKSTDEIKKFGFPCVLKSSSGGSSREVSILHSEKDLSSTLVRKLLDSGAQLYVEKYLNGVEVTVAILDGKALPIIEIVPPEGGWFDYQNKYWGQQKKYQMLPH